MRLKLVSLALLSSWLAVPLARAADGDSCKFIYSTPVIGSANAANIPMPTASAGLATTRAEPQIICRVLADKTAAGAFTAGPMWVPGGGQYIDLAVVRAIQGTSASGCGYDDVIVYTLSNTNTAAGAELVSIGVLDDDGTSTPAGGVKQIEHFGPIGPYLYLSGTATAGGDPKLCDSSNHLIIQLLLYPKSAIH